MKIRKNAFKFSLPDPNTFVGGVGATLTTRALMRAQLASTNPTIRRTMIKNYVNDGPNNDCSFYVRATYPRLGYVNSFNGNTALTYFVDEDGRVTNMQQGCFKNTTNFERIHLPGLTQINSPSGYATLSNTRIKGWVSLPVLAGQGANMNHIFNSSKVETFYMPLLTRIALQISARTCFAGITTLKRVYMPICVTLISDISSRIFNGAPAATIFYLDPFLETSDGGARDPHVIYWEDTLGCTIRYVTDTTAANDVTDLASTNITANSADLTFTPPTPNVNGNDFYEVWIDDGVSKWQKHVSWQEIVNSGDTLANLDGATNYNVKIRTVDTLHNYSIFSNIINFTTL